MKEAQRLTDETFKYITPALKRVEPSAKLCSIWSFICADSAARVFL
ncbi:MAG: hypothetical protein ACLR56_00460 [Oscillospiraceae bacterium]